MTASKPTFQNFLEFDFSFTLKIYSRSLANDLGCFPLDLEPSRPKSAYHLKNNLILSFTNFKDVYQTIPYINKDSTQIII